jgi:DNA-binding Xre family transcriptional regulator
MQALGYSTNMIKWNLTQIMKRHGISAIALSNALGVSRNSVSLHRRGFPRITENRLNDLLNALNALRRVDTPDIKIEELIEYRKD